MSRAIVKRARQLVVKATPRPSIGGGRFVRWDLALACGCTTWRTRAIGKPAPQSVECTRHPSAIEAKP